jgi:hypothetical protein
MSRAKNWYREKLEKEYGADAVEWAIKQVKGPFSYAFIEFLLGQQARSSSFGGKREQSCYRFRLASIEFFLAGRTI